MEDRRAYSVVFYAWVVVITIRYLLTIKYSGTPDKSNTLISQNKCRSVTKTLITQQINYRKLKHLVIGKSKKPKCFAGIKYFPVECAGNKITRMIAWTVCRMAITKRPRNNNQHFVIYKSQYYIKLSSYKGKISLWNCNIWCEKL